MIDYLIVIYTFCGPEVCTKEDYYNLQIPLANIVISNSSDIIFSHEYQTDHYESYSIGAIFMLTIIGKLACICITSTFIEALRIRVHGNSSQSISLDFP